MADGIVFSLWSLTALKQVKQAQATTLSNYTGSSKHVQNGGKASLSDILPQGSEYYPLHHSVLFDSSLNLSYTTFRF